MKRDVIKLNNPERFAEIPEISKEKLDKALEAALKRLRRMGEKNGVAFPAGSCSWNSQYLFAENDNWVHGMYTGCYWLAYQMTGDFFFKDMAVALTETFRERLDKRVGVDDHDMGFNFIPSCIAGHRITGDISFKKTALDAAEYFYGTGYAQKGKFIIRNWKGWKINGNPASCRTMMDSLMNAPLFYWAAKETGDQKYFQAAHDHVKTTEELLIRKDSSSYHHYQFDPKTEAPVGGVTWQGHSDESCWSRGHAWGVYGFPIAYNYDKSDFIKEVHHDVTYYFLNHLPEDLIPYWDFDFTSGDEPRDASAGAIAICGMLEMARTLDDGDPDKTVYRSAAAQMLESIIDNCTDLGEYDDGLINKVSCGIPQRLGVNQIAVYGDYFYLEAIARYKMKNFKVHW